MYMYDAFPCCVLLCRPIFSFLELGENFWFIFSAGENVKIMWFWHALSGGRSEITTPQPGLILV